jgi:hypothetical protein
MGNWLASHYSAQLLAKSTLGMQEYPRKYG